MKIVSYSKATVSRPVMRRLPTEIKKAEWNEEDEEWMKAKETKSQTTNTNIWVCGFQNVWGVRSIQLFSGTVLIDLLWRHRSVGRKLINFPKTHTLLTKIVTISGCQAFEILKKIQRIGNEFQNQSFFQVI